MTAIDRVHFELRAYPSVSSPDGVLVKYLKTPQMHPAQTKNELVLKACRLCWLPYAYRDAELKTGKDLRKIAESCAQHLEWHARELRSAFGIPAAPAYSPVTYAPQPVPAPAPEETEKISAAFVDNAKADWVVAGL